MHQVDDVLVYNKNAHQVDHIAIRISRVNVFGIEASRVLYYNDLLLRGAIDEGFIGRNFSMAEYDIYI